MKILQIIPNLNKGGAERLVLDICQEMNLRNGIQTKLVTLEESNAYTELTSGIDHQTCFSYVLPSITSKTKANVSGFSEIVTSFKPDVIHSHLFSAEMVSRYQLFPMVKYFTHCHDNMIQLEKFSHKTILSKKNITNFYERNFILDRYKKSNTHFIAISKDTFSYLNKVLPNSLKPNVRLLANAINFKKFNSVAHKRSIDEIRIVNTGSFVQKKNQLFLVEVMNCLNKMGVKAYVTFLGDGVEMQNVKRKTSEYGLDKFVSFPGSVYNVESYLKQANLYVHTATYEPFGLVLLEAMASGLPIISLDGKGNRDIVKDNWNGFFIPEQNPQLFAQKIISLMRDNEKYSYFSTNAVEFSKEFDIVNYVDCLLAIYKDESI